MTDEHAVLIATAILVAARQNPGFEIAERAPNACVEDARHMLRLVVERMPPRNVNQCPTCGTPAPRRRP